MTESTRPRGARDDQHDVIDRNRALAPIFEVTIRLAAYPPAPDFVALQKQLSDLIEVEAGWLASMPPIAAPALVAA